MIEENERNIKEGEGDNLFSIFEYEGKDYQFGVHYEIFMNSKYKKRKESPLFDNVIEHHLQMQYDIKKIKCFKGSESREFNRTEELIVMLARDVSNKDENTKKDYLEILHFCVGPELESFKHKGKSLYSKEIKEKFRKVDKFKEIIGPKYGWKGEGYGDLAKYIPIVISPNADENIKRLMVLLGSVNAGNTNEEGLKEYSAILDKLRENGIIDKGKHKILLHKYMDALRPQKKRE